MHGCRLQLITIILLDLSLITLVLNSVDDDNDDDEDNDDYDYVKGWAVLDASQIPYHRMVIRFLATQQLTFHGPSS